MTMAQTLLGEPNIEVTFDPLALRFLIEGVPVPGVRRFSDSITNTDDTTEDYLETTGTHTKKSSSMPGQWQAIRVDSHFSVLSNQDPLSADIAHRRKSGYHRQRIGSAKNNKIVDHLQRRWEVYSKMSRSNLQKMANDLHPFAWQAAEHLVNIGMRPIAGNIPVGHKSAKLATAIDGLWWHRAEKRFVVVELKKYETSDYSSTLQVAHQRQLALTAVLFVQTFTSSVHKPPLGVIVRVHDSGPTLYWLKSSALEWAKSLLTQRLLKTTRIATQITTS
jgi:hypothetical protein